jgi:hypothetical protein
MNPHSIPAARFDTALMPDDQAFEIWQTILDEFYEVVPTRSTEQQPHFAAALDMWNIDGVALTHGSFTAQRFVRTARRARRDGLDNYTILLHSQGKWKADAAGNRIESAQGRVCIVDFARPLVSEVTLNDSITLSLPREMLDGVLPSRNLHGKVLDGPRYFWPWPRNPSWRHGRQVAGRCRGPQLGRLGRLRHNTAPLRVKCNARKSRTCAYGVHRSKEKRSLDRTPRILLISLANW